MTLRPEIPGTKTPIPRKKTGFRAFAHRIRRQIEVYRLLLADRRTPRVAKVLLWAAVAYLLMPLDLVPDWVPVLGLLDDLVIVPGLVALGLWFVPRDVLADCRHRAETAKNLRKTGANDG